MNGTTAPPTGRQKNCIRECVWRRSFCQLTVQWKHRSVLHYPISNNNNSNNRCKRMQFSLDLCSAAPGVLEENRVTSTTSWDTEEEES
ncbi:uncharacterized protein LOC141785346 isoform X1 [Halichoeres trimaculatus]|uniref:uncharacterized protein LOC141785346 isoform X1 n=1 Tax=Halichoeres trimaculatus TaxID=147232 RepID=UPI003D9E195F